MSARLIVKDLAVRGRLQPCSLTVQAGEFVGLIGPNGAGKSTLLRAAMGLIAATGHSSIAAMPAQSRVRHAAYLAQERHLVWPISVKDLVDLGRRAHPDHRQDPPERTTELLARLGLSEFSARPVTLLSGGEQARVLLARALAQGSPLLLADEPCAALDPAQSIQTARLLAREAQAGGAVVASFHDLPLAARWCSRLIVMAGGKICADGPPHSLLTPALVERVFGCRLTRMGEDYSIGPLKPAQGR